MRIVRFASLLMLLTLALSACATTNLTADEVMQKMQQARDNLQTAHGVVAISLTSPDRSGTFKVEGWGKKTGTTDAAGKPIAKAHLKVLEATGENSDKLIGTELVHDSETFWLYNPAENKVVTGKISDIKKGDVGAQDPTAQMLQMQEMLQRILDGSDVTIESESEQVAGRDTRKIKLTPKPETQQQLQLGSAIATNLWIDKATDLPVKATVDAGDLGQVEITAESLELNQPIADDVFTFTPPAGAEIVDAAELAKQARPEATTLADAKAKASFPVLEPGSLPDGVQLDNVQLLQLRGESIVQNYSGPVVFSLVQSKGGFPGDEQAPTGAQAQSVTVRGQAGTLITGSGAQQGTMLRWQEGDVTVVLAGTLSADQALQIAEALK